MENVLKNGINIVQMIMAILTNYKIKYFRNLLIRLKLLLIKHIGDKIQNYSDIVTHISTLR